MNILLNNAIMFKAPESTFVDEVKAPVKHMLVKRMVGRRGENIGNI